MENNENVPKNVYTKYLSDCILWACALGQSRLEGGERQLTDHEAVTSWLHRYQILVYMVDAIQGRALWAAGTNGSDLVLVPRGKCDLGEKANTVTHQSSVGHQTLSRILIWTSFVRLTVPWWYQTAMIDQDVKNAKWGEICLHIWIPCPLTSQQPPSLRRPSQHT